jgi:hypothetical protein
LPVSVITSSTTRANDLSSFNPYKEGRGFGQSLRGRFSLTRAR